MESTLPVLRLFLADARPLAGLEDEILPLLTPQRRQAVSAATLPEDRLHAAAAGLLLHSVLGVTFDDALSKNNWGKPCLAGGPGFNLSHGGHYAALALFTQDVGVDIEPLRDPPHVVPTRFLTSEELEWYQATPSEERFCHLWTRLESALKADGRGFSFTDRSFSVVESGTPWYLETLTHDGHVLSCAAAIPFTVQLTVVDTQTLLAP